MMMISFYPNILYMHVCICKWGTMIYIYLFWFTLHNINQSIKKNIRLWGRDQPKTFFFDFDFKFEGFFLECKCKWTKQKFIVRIVYWIGWTNLRAHLYKHQIMKKKGSIQVIEWNWSLAALFFWVHIIIFFFCLLVVKGPYLPLFFFVLFEIITGRIARKNRLKTINHHIYESRFYVANDQIVVNEFNPFLSLLIVWAFEVCLSRFFFCCGWFWLRRLSWCFIVVVYVYV